jgi:RHS repeat-associated protein
VYCDDDAVDAGTRRMAMPVQVVSKVRREDGSGVGTHADTNYAYHSLRVDPDGRGPLGFHRVIASDQASGVTTQTTYGQAYPYTGAPTKVERYQMINGTSFQLSSTTTNYCDSFITDQAGNPICSQPGTKYGPLTSLFVYPYNVDDQAYLHPETNDKTNMIETVTNFRYDPFGNATKISTTTTKTEAQQTEVITTEIDNDYGMGNSQEQLQGRITETRATNTGGGRTNHHKTDYIYQPVSTFGGLSTTALTLLKKQVELGSAWPLELHTAYGYDQFGNTTLTTNCANDFSQCSAGASGPANTGDPFHHPPFRTVSVTYDLQGLFPTHTTNAVGHTDSTTFDPFKGVLLQRIDPNGGINCYTYDTIGRQTSVTERCGSDNPIETTTQYFLISTSVVAGGGDIPQTVVAPGTPPNSRTITVTRPATGQATWTFADDQGKAAGTVTRSFDGGLIETRSQYTALGQVAFVAKPFELQSFADSTVIPYGQTTTYDDFKRVFQVTDELGLLDAAGVPRTLMTQTTYNGSSLTASTTVNGMPETKTQTKNALGKLASIVDNNGKKISYTYDAEGNLLTTTDQAGNVVQLDYDTRGRKSLAVDPDLGQWTYTADGFGDIVSQTDGKGQTVTMMYDPLARMIIRANSTNPADAAEWIYDVAPGAGKGKLAFQISASDPKFTGACPITSRAQVAGGLRAVKSFAYTPFGDVQEVSDCADGATFMTSYEYDSLGRQSVIKYPAVSGPQLTIWSHYTRAGFLHYLTEDAPSEPGLLWQAKAYSPLGQVTDEQARNGVETVANRNAVSGWILGSTSTAHADAGTMIQNSSFTYDEAGDLLTRTRSDQVNDAASSESFTYDGLNRIMTSHVDVNALNYHAADTYGYDDLGNLNNKGGNSYGYGTGCLAGSRFAGPHAVCTDHTGGTPFVYDGNGNMTAGKGRTIQYNFENKPVHIQSPGGSIDFMYGADGNRVVQLVASGSTTSRTVYVGLGGTGKSMYERTTGSDGSIQHVYFIYAGAAHGGNAFAVRVLNGTTTADRYFSFDHLGSTTAVSDEKGHIGSASGPDANVLGYDAWGARRNPDGTTTAGATFNQQPGHREFTGHEAIPDVGLVNMNGRVYDPVLGRFLSPDPNVQNLSDLQTYNRYSYVLNNPLRYTDPTGYFWSEIGTFFKNYFSNPFNDLELLGGIVVCATSAGAGCIVMGLMMTAMNTAIAIDSGAPVDQSLLNAAVGVSIGFLTGGAVSAAGGGPLSQIIAGGASAALATGISNSISHKDFLGYNMLGAALASAATGAVTYGLKQVTALSQAGGKYLKEDPDTGPGWYKLNKQGLSALKPVFDQYGYDVEDVRVHIGDSVVNLGGYQRTLGDSVYINGSSWQRLSDDEQLFTLGHEITHSAQWNEGHVTFAGRYLYEEVKFGQYDQYNVPSSLKSMSVGSFDLRNSNYTLDEIADRIGYEVAPKATSMYQVKPLSAYGF